MWDAIVVGSGPNGLAAAITLAREGRKVLVREAQPTIGGGCRTLELTLPGFRHDICSAIHPLAAGSPFLRSIPLAAHGVEWIRPTPLAHPLDDGTAVMLEPTLAETDANLDPEDAGAWSRLIGPFSEKFDALVDEILAPPHVPQHPALVASFGTLALTPATKLAKRFHGPRARALFAGLAGHSVSPLDRPPSSAFSLLLGAAAATVGWPFPRGGSQSIVDAMVSYLKTLGGEVVADAPVTTVDELDSKLILLDLAPSGLLRVAGHRLTARYRSALAKYRHGPGSFKLDYALSEPIPWKAPEARRAGCLHLAGTLEEVAAAEVAAWDGHIPEKPHVLVAQQSLFDGTRAPEGRHTAWAYCHVPNGATEDMTARIEAQIERFAPGFRDVVLARSVRSPAELERTNANLVGGDMGGGAFTVMQTVFRPMVRWNPYRTPAKGIYLCSASTSPGGGVHGMCGFHAARTALADGF